MKKFLQETIESTKAQEAFCQFCTSNKSTFRSQIHHILRMFEFKFSPILCVSSVFFFRGKRLECPKIERQCQKTKIRRKSSSHRSRNCLQMPKKTVASWRERKNSSRGLELHIFQNPTMFNRFVYIESFGGGKKVYLKKYSIAVLLKMSGYILSHDCFNSFLWQSKKLFKKITPPDLEFCLALKWQANLGACFRRNPPNPILLLCRLLFLHYPTIFGPK